MSFLCFLFCFFLCDCDLHICLFILFLSNVCYFLSEYTTLSCLRVCFASDSVLLYCFSRFSCCSFRVSPSKECSPLAPPILVPFSVIFSFFIFLYRPPLSSCLCGGGGGALSKGFRYRLGATPPPKHQGQHQGFRRRCCGPVVVWSSLWSSSSSS